jgi:hypothetical protein
VADRQAGFIQALGYILDQAVLHTDPVRAILLLMTCLPAVTADHFDRIRILFDAPASSLSSKIKTS